MSQDIFKNCWDIQSRASALGFDWPDVSGVLDKIAEELQEVRDALANDDVEHARRELGDLFFACVNLARFLGIAPEEAVHQTNRRFEKRFAAVENEVRRMNRTIESCSLGELDAIWERVKHDADQRLEKRG